MPVDRERLYEMLVEELEVDMSKVVPGATLQQDLGADSLDVVELIMKIEEAFEVNLPDEDVQKVVTVDDLIALIESKQNAAPA